MGKKTSKSFIVIVYGRQFFFWVPTGDAFFFFNL